MSGKVLISYGNLPTQILGSGTIQMSPITYTYNNSNQLFQDYLIAEATKVEVEKPKPKKRNKVYKKVLNSGTRRIVVD